MPVRRFIKENNGIYFITITCARWLRLFEMVNAYDVVYKWFDYLKSKGHFISAYVIMPNHLHVLIAFRNTDKPINKIVGEGKRFMSYDIVRKLMQLNDTKVLNILSSFVNSTDRARNKRHEIFEPSFDWKECYGVEFIEQKLNYIHMNPCNGNWNLVQNPEEYVHSSAKYYYLGELGIYPVTNYMELDDIDLTKSD